MYEKKFLKDLFNEMGTSYERVGDICSFGFNRLWRRKAVALLDLQPGEKVCDMMSGTGEGWKYILPQVGGAGEIYAVDFSPEMTRLAELRQKKLGADNVHVMEGDALAMSLPAQSMDAVFSAYGVKTLPENAYAALAAEVDRVLKPGGKASFMEVSMPQNRLHRAVFKTFLNIGFPVLKFALGKKAAHFEMFGKYLRKFENCKKLSEAFRTAGFDVKYVRLAGDGATAVFAQKPALKQA